MKTSAFRGFRRTINIHFGGYGVAERTECGSSHDYIVITLAECKIATGVYFFVGQPWERGHDGVAGVARQVPDRLRHAHQRYPVVIPEHVDLDGSEEHAKRHGQTARPP